MPKADRVFYLWFLSFALITTPPHPHVYARNDPVDHTNPSGPKTIYLTFDDGPVGGTENVLDALDETEVTATFFLVGEHIEKTGKKRLLPRIRNYGFGNHSYSHWAKESAYARRTPHDYVEDFRKADMSILERPGKVVTCRLPGNQPRQKKAFVRALGEDGRNVIGWDVEITSALTKTPVKAAEEMLSHKKDTLIVLLHDAHFNRRRGKEDLISMIKLLKGAGCEFEKF